MAEMGMPLFLRMTQVKLASRIKWNMALGVRKPKADFCAKVSSSYGYKTILLNPRTNAN